MTWSYVDVMLYLSVKCYKWSSVFPGHGWGAAEESHGDGGYGDSPVSFEGGDHSGYALSGGEEESYGSEGGHGGY